MNRRKKKAYTIEVSQNGWEYSGFVTITCFVLNKVSDTEVLADGISIEFDEEIIVHN